MESVTFAKRLVPLDKGKRWMITIPKDVAEKLDKTALYEIALRAVDTVSVARKEDR